MGQVRATEEERFFLIAFVFIIFVNELVISHFLLFERACYVERAVETG
jgi:hypothetical protein